MFFNQENVAISNEQMMKTKLRTFTHKQILCKPLKKLVKK